MIDQPKIDAPGQSVGLPDEDEFMSGANRAIQRAIEASHRSGVATTHERNGKLVQVSPDGQAREIGTLRRP